MIHIGRFARAFAISVAAAGLSLTLNGCMTLEQDRAVQSPRLPPDRAVAWSPWNRFYRSVTVDYVAGMDQHSYLFGKASQAAYRPMLEYILDQTGMRAPTNLAARYGIRVEFKQIQGNAIGTDFTSKSTAVYSIVNRMTGETVYQQEIPASFTAIFPGANENDLANVYKRFPESAGFLGLAAAAYGASQFHHTSISNQYFTADGILFDLITKKSYALTPEAHADMIKVYQSSIAFALFNEAWAGLDAFKPWNFVAFANFSGTGPLKPVLGAPRGVLSEGGIGARSGTEREKQADAMMLGQSLTKFVIGLAGAEHVQFITRLPCSNNIEVQEMKNDLEARGMLWESDDCMQYQASSTSRGEMDYTSGH